MLRVPARPPRLRPGWPCPAATPPRPSAWGSQTACRWSLACSLASSRDHGLGCSIGHSGSAGPLAPPPPQQAAASRLLRAGPPASAASVLSASGCCPLAGSLSRPWRPTTPVAASTLAFSRSVQEPQTRLTPPSRRAPPGQSSGHPPGSSRENSQTPRFRCHLDYANDASTARTRPESTGPGASGTSSWSPPDAIKRAFSLSLTTTVFSQRSTGWFDASPPKGDAGGPTSLHLSHSTAYLK